MTMQSQILRRVALSAALALCLGPLTEVSPVLAAPTVAAADHDVNWGTQERHFPQNKQAESPMATNPTNGQNSISGAEDFVQEPDCTIDPSTGGSVCYPGQTINTIAAYTTTDGGTTWNKHILDFSAIGKVANADPSVAFGPKPNGSGGFTYATGARAYFSAMAFPLGNVSPYAEPIVAVTHSDDGGSTWSTPVIGTNMANRRTQFDDKPSVWADNNPASPYFGNVYLVWALITGVGSSHSTFFCSTCPIRILVARSTDGGQTWSNAQTLSPSSDTGPNGYRELPFVRTDRDGRVVVIWEEHIGATKGQQSEVVAAVSTDGGQHFGLPMAVGPTFDMNPLPGSSFPNPNTPGMDIDQSSDTMYVAWADYHPVAGGPGHGVVTVMKSTDHGQSWSSAGSIDAPGRSPFHPSLAVGRQGSAPAASSSPGRVVVSFTALTDVSANTPPVGGAANFLPFVTASDDGGAMWSAPISPSGSGPSDPAAAAGFLNDFVSEFVGDYSSMSASPDSKTFFDSYSSTQEGATCAAVDAYRTGTGPAPNIYASCPPTFGNVDIHVAAINTSP